VSENLDIFMTASMFHWSRQYQSSLTTGCHKPVVI